MSEEAPVYETTDSIDIQAFSQLACAQHKDDAGFKVPSPEEIKALRNYLGLSQVACARFTGVSYKPEKGSSIVRKWETSKENRNHKPIPYAAWRLLLAAAKVIDLDEDIEISKQRPSI
ncbi:DNA-binding transcriptional regulator [Motiliproteus sp. MSK22-1]|uniref:helix-turn-helix domain-containing protein n=1 Tax=Motiliproteus sp. MSK22-1 TaxID=1897630 RepID=UPI0009765D15|nr:hypothetical protein [Motiliproteus sp. MSK22-1]OMH28090.1 hypothetical protein BGP75_22245 [Motiliproteus sp. MSK22-1]